MSYPNVQGISVTVDNIVSGSPEGSPSEIGKLIELDRVLGASRNIKKYYPINSDDQIVALGRQDQKDITFGVIYDPELSEGVHKLESAIANKTEVQIVMELPNKLTDTGHGTQYTRTCLVSEFDVVGEQDGKFVANVVVQTLGTPSKTAAA